MANKKQLAKKKFLKQKKKEDYLGDKIEKELQQLPEAEQVQFENEIQRQNQTVQVIHEVYTKKLQYQKTIDWEKIIETTPEIALTTFDTLRLYFLNDEYIDVPKKYVHQLQVEAKKIKIFPTDHLDYYYQAQIVLTLADCMHTKFKIYHTEDSSFIGRSSIKERYFKFKVDLSKIELWKDGQSVVRYYLPDDIPCSAFSMSRFQKNEAKNGKYQFLSAVVDEPYRIRDFMMHWELDTVRHDFLNLLSQTATDSNLELDRYSANRLLMKMVEEAKEGPKESGYIIKMRADERLKGIAMEFEINHEPTTYNKILSLGKNPSLVNDIIIGYENEETEEAVILYENRENVIFSLVLKLLIDISMDMKEAHS